MTEARARHKTFDVPDADDSEPLSFDLKYKSGEVETFNCYPEIPGKLLIDLMKPAAAADEDRAGVMMAVSVLEFFPQVMDEDEWARLESALNDRKRVVSMEQLSNIMSWLVEEYSERPTQQP